MKPRVHRLAIPFALLMAGAAAPALAGHEDLPPEEYVIRALDAHPSVQAAAARLDAAKAQAAMLRVGTHEATIQGSFVRRSVQTEGDYNEFDTTILRPFRLPGKASLDKRAGNFGVDAAHNRMEDVRHQTSLSLASLWYDWLTASEQQRTDRASVDNLDRALAAVRRREQLKDAAALDSDQAASALALAKGQLADSVARASVARATLAATFPDLPLPVDPPALAMPHGLDTDFMALRQLVIERSHEIGAARADADKQATLARRARADRIADPSVGVRLFSERSGMEKGAGVVASIPLGGRYRARAADEAQAMAGSARMELGAVEREVAAMADADLSNARTRLAAWQELAEAVKRAEAVTQRSDRGYKLGATDLSDLLYAQRQAQDARRAEINARSEALRAILKLEIDAHVIWMPPEEAAEHGAPGVTHPQD